MASNGGEDGIKLRDPAALAAAGKLHVSIFEIPATCEPEDVLPVLRLGVNHRASLAVRVDSPCRFHFTGGIGGRGKNDRFHGVNGAGGLWGFRRAEDGFHIFVVVLSLDWVTGGLNHRLVFLSIK